MSGPIFDFASNLQAHHSSVLDVREQALMAAMVAVRDKVGPIVKSSEGHDFSKGAGKPLFYASREKLLAALMPVVKEAGMHLYFTGGESPAPGMTRQMLVVVGMEGEQTGARCMFSQDFPSVAGGGKDAGQATGSVMTYAARYLLTQAFALELILEKDPDSKRLPEHTGPVPKCKECGKEMNRRIAGKKSRNPGTTFWVCPDKNFKKEDGHSFCFAMKLLMKGTEGDWEELSDKNKPAAAAKK